MEQIKPAPYTPPSKLSVARDGRLVLDGWLRSSFFVENKGYGWTISEQWRASDTVAVFSTRRRALQAIQVFCEGVTRAESESTADAWRRAIRLCAATGSTSTLGFRRA